MKMLNAFIIFFKKQCDFLIKTKTKINLVKLRNYIIMQLVRAICFLQLYIDISANYEACDSLSRL